MTNSCAVASAEGASISGREYLAYFLHRHLDFRLPELESLIAFENSSISYSWRKAFGDREYSPFWYLRLPSDDVAKRLCNRVLLLRVGAVLFLIPLSASLWRCNHLCASHIGLWNIAQRAEGALVMCRASLRSGAKAQHGMSSSSLSMPFLRSASCPGLAQT